MTIWRWAKLFSDTPQEHQVTLGEGDTPLVPSRCLGPSSGLNKLYFKLESTNPSGSYKDRFGASTISDMLANGQRRCIATSSGNTGAAVAAYCAATGLACEIFIVESTPAGKLKQMLAYGAKLYRVRGMGIDPAVSDRVWPLLEQKAARPDARLQISAFHYSPEGMAGVQTISYELSEQAAASGHDIDHVFSPAGGGGLTLAVARGFAGLVERGERAGSPAVHCVQPEGNNTMAGPLREGAQCGQAVTCTSDISGLQVGSVIDADQTIPACRASGGTGHLVDDDSTWRAQKRLALEEGIFCEPAGAVALAGALDAANRGEVGRDDHVVCLVTGVGFKDPPAVDRMVADCECPLIDVEQIGDT